MLRRVTALALGVLLMSALAAGAQSFGRNKVHYEDFDFRILETPHFDIYYYPAEHDAVVQAGRLAERWYARLSRALDHKFRQRQPIVLYGSHAQFSQTNVIPGFLGEGIGGVTEHQRGRVVLPFAAGLGETDHVLGHELVHAFQRDILKRNGRSISRLPLWFVEGMAEYLSVGRVDPNTAMWLRDSVEQNRLPRIDQLSNPRWFPYRYGQALWVYLANRFGEDVVARALKSKASGGAIGRIAAVTGVDARALTTGWHESLRKAATPSSAPAGGASTAIISDGRNGGRLNIGPSLSPDGRSLAFLSERDEFSIDVFLADAATGAIRQKVVQTAGDPHFDSLQFIESSGAWDPPGRRFVLAALARGQAVLTILDVQSGGVQREIRLPQFDQIFNPAWSPDGRQIVFSALHGGLSDLQVVDVGSGAVRAITSDPFADLQPSWSPDGRTIVFSTDRFTSSMTTLTFGNYRLAAVDVASGTIRELPGLPGAKNIDPHWSADGASVYFIADPDGVSNVYRLDVATGDRFQVTHVSTGISGVTALSPALSVAGDRIAFSVYRQGAYEIHTLATAVGTPVLAAASAVAPNVVAPAPESTPPGATVAEHVQVTGGLLDGQEFTVKPYRRKLSFDGVAQPYLSAGGGATGSFLRAGVSLSFGDMLGDQQLDTTLQVGKSLGDFAAQASYVNLRSRWNWGIVGGQVPWVVAGAEHSSLVPAATPGGAKTIRREVNLLRQIHRQLAGVAIYPFSGAKRIEFTGGVQAISFDRSTTTSIYSAATGRVMNESTATSRLAPSTTLVETGVALVNDTAVFGATSPVLGERYRFEVAPTLGHLTFATVTADYRRYIMPVRPFTLAVRAMHMGRYGGDADDPRLLPLVWTLRDVVRGYGDTGSLPYSACGAPATTAGCTALGYLGAKRLVAGNIELRFPIPGAFKSGPHHGRVPLEGLIFSDVAAFWTRGLLPQTSRNALRSGGVGIRLNAAGAVFEFDAVRRLDQAPRGWGFAFNFRPGF